MNHTRSPYAANSYRDYDVHLLIEDEKRNYLLKIGTIYERHSGEISGDTIHGTLIMRRLRDRHQDPERFTPIKSCSAMPATVHNGHLNA